MKINKTIWLTVIIAILLILLVYLFSEHLMTQVEKKYSSISLVIKSSPKTFAVKEKKDCFNYIIKNHELKIQ